MHTQSLKRYFSFSLLLVVFSLLSVPAQAQERRPSSTIDGPIHTPCPRAIAPVLIAVDPASLTAGDFTPAQIAAQVGLNNPTPNKHYLYTFRWAASERCCQITSGRLTVKTLSNQSGSSHGDSRAGNDSLGIMVNGLSIFGTYIYPNHVFPFGANFPMTTTWQLSPIALSDLNNTHDFSFAVQDDTRVVSATLELSGCCLGPPRSSTIEDVSPLKSGN